MTHGAAKQKHLMGPKPEGQQLDILRKPVIISTITFYCRKIIPSCQEIAVFELARIGMSSSGIFPFQHFKDRKRTHKVFSFSHIVFLPFWLVSAFIIFTNSKVYDSKKYFKHSIWKVLRYISLGVRYNEKKITVFEGKHCSRKGKEWRESSSVQDSFLHRKHNIPKYHQSVVNA